MGYNSKIREAALSLLDFLYPGACLGCNDYIENHEMVFCAACEKKIAEVDFFICGICGAPMSNADKCTSCQTKDTFPVLALGQYQDPLKEAIHQFKFQHIRRASEILAVKIMELHRDKIEKLNPELIIPVPLHSIRMKVRGFNQAEDLARSLSQKLDIPLYADIIEKRKQTRDQARLKAERRLKNLKGVFKSSGKSLQGERVIIVDDVFTTGATMREVRMAILEAGGKPVLGLAAAVAGL